MNQFRLTIAFLLLCLAGVSHSAEGQTYIPTDKGSKIEFVVKRPGTTDKLRGRLSGIKGKIVFDTINLQKSVFDVTVEAGTVITGDKEADNKVKSGAFFNAFRYPTFRFVSTSLKKDKPNSIVYTLIGMLTIKGISKSISIPFSVKPKNGGLQFRGAMQISRQLFGVGDKEVAENEVNVFIEVFAKKG